MHLNKCKKYVLPSFGHNIFLRLIKSWHNTKLSHVIVSFFRALRVAPILANLGFLSTEFFFEISGRMFSQVCRKLCVESALYRECGCVLSSLHTSVYPSRTQCRLGDNATQREITIQPLTIQPVTITQKIHSSFLILFVRCLLVASQHGD